LPGVGHVTHALCDLLFDEIHDPGRRDLGWCAPKKSLQRLARHQA